MEVWEHERLGWGMDVKNNEKKYFGWGEVWRLGRNMVLGKLTGIHKDDPT